ncbi:nucleoside 2-deoxyribosyltransferase [Saccharothrix saharensis]|uniref:nucleoside 2-deoxyribosyltransferase n=1 Tax=Saccharothrix saharensis TaxID=571190 RepID=UPI0036AB91D7
MSARRVFLGGPFKASVDPATGTLRAAERARLESVIARLERDGHEVHNAHRREGWGAAFLTPEECTRLDFEEISASDVFVAFPGAPASPGTHVEIGWASALGKPVVLLLEDGAEYAFLVRGLHTVADVVFLPVGPDSDVAELVAGAVRDIGARTAVGER